MWTKVNENIYFTNLGNEWFIIKPILLQCLKNQNNRIFQIKELKREWLSNADFGYCFAHKQIYHRPRIIFYSILINIYLFNLFIYFSTCQNFPSYLKFFQISFCLTCFMYCFFLYLVLLTYLFLNYHNNVFSLKLYDLQKLLKRQGK